MFEGFTFDQQKVDSAADPDVDSNVSPRDDGAADWQRPNAAAPPAMPTSTPHLHRHLEHAAEPIDSLVLQMREQSLLSNSQRKSHVERWILENEPATVEHAPVVQSIQETIPSQPPAQQTRTSAAAIPSESLRSLRPCLSNSLEINTTNNGIAPMVAGSQTPELEMDICSAGNTFNPRAARETLLELMIARGVQCTVQSSTPTTPVLVSRPSLPSMALSCGLGDDDLMADGGMSLEVDEGYDEHNDDVLLNSLVSLRQAGVPGGIPRRSGGLRYRRSAELAMQGKNLRHNTLKMRKRSRPKMPTSTPPLADPPTDASMDTPCT